MTTLKVTQLNKLYQYPTNMVTTELDITRYLELMDSLAKKEMSLLAFSEKKYFELLRYQVIFENEIFFNQR